MILMCWIAKMDNLLKQKRLNICYITKVLSMVILTFVESFFSRCSSKAKMYVSAIQWGLSDCWISLSSNYPIWSQLRDTKACKLETNVMSLLVSRCWISMDFWVIALNHQVKIFHLVEVVPRATKILEWS